MRNEDRPHWFKVKAIFLQNCKDTVCHYCGVLITKQNMSVDHKHPIAKGGGVFDLNNLALCCKKCNRLKSDYDYEYFKNNREEILKNLMNRIKEKNSRREELEKWITINGSKNLSDWFIDVEFNPMDENEIKMFRKEHLSLVRFSPTLLEFNFSEKLPDEMCEVIKEKVGEVLKKLGTPVKAMKNYVDSSGKYILFENNVLLNMDNFSQKVLNKQELNLFNNGQYKE